MGSVGEKLDYLEETKAMMAAALAAQGVDVSDVDTFRSYAEKIATIGKLPDITEEDEGKILRVVKGIWAISEELGLDETLKIQGKAADAKATGVRIETLEKHVADLLYKIISIKGFSNNVGTVEIGSTVDNVTLSWSFNKTPTALTLDGVEQAVDAEGAVLKELGLTAAKTWKLVATDERGATASKTTSVSFLNGIYYGVGTAQDAYDSAFILGLTKTLLGSKLASFTVNAGDGKHIYYCLPKRYGTCTFTVGGFDGGFDLIDTVSFTNASGYAEDYYIYKSTNAGLGSTNVGVK